MDSLFTTHKCSLRTLLCYLQPLLTTPALLVLALLSLLFLSAETQAKLTITVTNDSNNESAKKATREIAANQQLIKQRQLYKRVDKDLQRGSTTSFIALGDSLKSYPLYPYLQYTHISQNIKLSNEGAIAYFLSDFPDVRVSPMQQEKNLLAMHHYIHQPYSTFG